MQCARHCARLDAVPTMRIVPALDELKHRAASFDRRVECAAVKQLTFQRGEETLAQRVVASSSRRDWVAITDGTHGRAHHDPVHS